MSVSLSVKAVSSKESPEFKKHLGAVEYCLKNKLSFPKETIEFFKDNFDGDSLADYDDDYIIESIKDGIQIPMQVKYDYHGNGATIKVKDIPGGCDEILITLS